MESEAMTELSILGAIFGSHEEGILELRSARQLQGHLTPP